MLAAVFSYLVKAEGQFTNDGRAVFICSFVQIAIQNLQLRYNMDVLYSIEDLIAAFGGLFGLCTGASLLRSHILLQYTAM